MANNTSNLIDKLIKALEISNKKKTSSYDTAAIVRRIEGDTAWVHIDGGVDETPVKLTINAKEGDSVRVRVGGGTAFLIGNGTAPPTDDTKAIAADEKAGEAKKAAKEAYEYADIAKEAADNAVVSAGVAKQAADNSLMQLSIVEDVAGTLNWISEHGSYVASTDTAVNPSTVYFELVSGDYVPIVNPDPTANPSTEGWYVLDVTDSQAEYIMAHLAVTSAGLWVLPAGQLAEYQMVDSANNELVDDASNLFAALIPDPQRATGYKVLLSATGMTVFDDTGTAVAVYSDTVTIGEASGNNVHINSSRVAVRDGLTELATFGASESRIGDASDMHVVIDSDSVEFNDGTEQRLAIGVVSTSDYSSIGFNDYMESNGMYNAGIYGHAGTSSESAESRILIRTSDVVSNPKGLAQLDLQSTTYSNAHHYERAILTAEYIDGFDIYRAKLELRTGDASSYSPRAVFNCDIYNQNGKIGQRYTDVVTKTLSSVSDVTDVTNGAYVTLPAGIYILCCWWQFGTSINSSTARTMQISYGNSTTTWNSVRIKSPDSSWQQLQVTGTIELSASTDVYVKGATTNGYSTANNTIIQAVRIA